MINYYFLSVPVPTNDAHEVELATLIQKDPSSSSYTITCRVCQNRIDVSDKQEQFVVKCWYCAEATVSI